MSRSKKWQPGHITVVAKCNTDLASRIDDARQLLTVGAHSGGTRCMNRGEFTRWAVARLVEDLQLGTMTPEDFRGLLEGEAAVREVKRWETDSDPEEKT